MKRKLLQGAVVLSVLAGLLALAGCDTPVEETKSDDGNWLAKVSNPFIGTWGYSSTNMNTGAVTSYELEFKTDGTVVQKTTPTGSSATTTTLYYLIKDKYIVISSASGYTKYQFSVPNNNQIAIVSTGNPTYYNRVGAENPNADRTLNLTTSLEGYWRSSIITSTTTMYDWYTFRKNGTYHVYHWMNNTPQYVDRGEFSYYIDNSSRLVTMNRLYDVTVYYNFTKVDNTTFSWATTSGGTAVSFSSFDGMTFTVQ